MATVQFILGRSGFGKTRYCIDAARAALKGAQASELITPSPLRSTPPSQGESLQRPLVLLVPEQATYQVERAVLSHPDIRGFSRLRVLSFNRLGFWLGMGADAGREISHTGRQMILHKLLLEMSGSLRLYKGDPRRTGLAAKLSELLTELQVSECPPQQIATLAQSLAAARGQELAAAKWADIAGIYAGYEQFFADGRFSNPDAALSRVRKNVRSAAFLTGAHLWVDGFSGFSIQELHLLSGMIDVCSEVSIALCLDPSTLDLSESDETCLDPCSLFASTEQTYCQLLRMLRTGKHDIAKPVLLTEPKRFENAPALGYIEKLLSDKKKPKVPSVNDSLQIAACADVRAETVYLARQIRRLVQNNELRYRDIAVVAPVMDTYQHYIKSAFDAYSLPYFIDRPRLMKTHPLARLIGSALGAVSGGFALGDVLSFLKTGMAGIPVEQVDALETYCRAFDIHCGHWRQKQPWDFAPADEKHFYDEMTLDKVRRDAIGPLLRLADALGAADTITAADFVRALWDLLQTLNVQGVLAEWAADSQTEHEQLFGELVALADEMCEIFQDRPLGAETWSSIFSEALSNLTVKLIPPTLDQVLVGSIERSRHPDIKVVFLIGAVQKQFPIPVIGEQLLSETDYKTAAAAELDLPDAYSRQLALRPYLSYIALTRASQQVYLTYPLLDEKGSAVVPWSGLERLQSMFTDLKVQYPSFNIGPEDIQTQEQLSQWLASTLGRDQGNRQLAIGNSEEIAAGILDCMASSDDVLKQVASRVREALAYENAASLDDGVAETLFTFPMKTSVSRLGTFAKCPYQYFAKYTLGLEPRRLLRFEPMDVGKFYHAVLEAMFNTLKSQGKNWADCSDDELLIICEEQMEKVLAADTQLTHFMQRRAHHAYRIEAAKETLRSFVPALAQLARASQFKQAAAELKFGFDESFQFILSLDGDRHIRFRGYIDRLDTAEINDQTAGLVYDYKSSTKKASFTDMLYGLDLQLPGYLLALHAKNIIPVGAFFIPIDTGTPSKRLSELEQSKEKFPNKGYGLFNGDFFEAIDTQAVPSKPSQHYNFRVSKEGHPYSDYNRQGALKPDDFGALLNHTETCAKKLITDLAAGTITVTPYRLGTTSPCTYCDYRPLCRFDWQVNEYNILESVDKERALEKMKEV